MTTRFTSNFKSFWWFSKVNMIFPLFDMMISSKKWLVHQIEIIEFYLQSENLNWNQWLYNCIRKIFEVWTAISCVLRFILNSWSFRSWWETVDNESNHNDSSFELDYTRRLMSSNSFYSRWKSFIEILTIHARQLGPIVQENANIFSV